MAKKKTKIFDIYFDGASTESLEDLNYTISSRNVVIEKMLLKARKEVEINDDGQATVMVAIDAIVTISEYKYPVCEDNVGLQLIYIGLGAGHESLADSYHDDIMITVEEEFAVSALNGIHMYLLVKDRRKIRAR